MAEPPPAVADGHVHTEWSWDADAGDMEATCARAVAIGLPVVAFTEHLDHTASFVPEHVVLPEHLAQHLDGTRLVPPPFDVAGYLECIERCRDRFPDLRILSGLELGEPHWHAEAVRAVLAAGTFDRLLGSLHCLPDGDTYAEPPGLFVTRGLDEVFRQYLLEIPRLVEGSKEFSVLAHIDYPLRYWHSTDPVDVTSFEEEFRVALAAVAADGRALEINTVLPLDAVVLRWWYDVGGEAITFGSDAHEPEELASGFREAVQMAEACGFRPGTAPFELWRRG